MLQEPDHHRNLSMRLSEVLDDIGVNERMLAMRRKMAEFSDTITKIYTILHKKSGPVVMFGSQAEGSTTEGLYSDSDMLFIKQGLKVIQEWREWKPGKNQWLMIQNETTSPGYCLLQQVISDVPLPTRVIQDKHHIIDNSGRVLLRHSLCLENIPDGGVRHGPAVTIPGQNLLCIYDSVSAIRCLSWPKEALPWLREETVSGWPTQEMKRYVEEHGCFVVPVASKTSIYPDLEWRISTNYAEKYLMMNLSLTQMRCYILMKMILKTFVEPKCMDTISSFMCKNILFHCIANLSGIAWCEPSTVQCLKQCLQLLLDNISTGNCPHFIIPGNNLLAGKLNMQEKQQLSEIVSGITENIEQSLLGIGIDCLGERLHVKSGGLPIGPLMSSDQLAYYISGKLVHKSAGQLCLLLFELQKALVSLGPVVDCDFVPQYIARLFGICVSGNIMEQTVCNMFFPFLCTQQGSILASEDVKHSRAVSEQAFKWFFLGLNSDVTLGRLKLASVLYCSGDMARCNLVLSATSRHVENIPVFSRCCCCSKTDKYIPENGRLCYEKHENAIKENFVPCVCYVPSEVQCVPVELRYEMFRSSQNDLLHRGKDDKWMDCAVVDSMPYLYFLQYKLFSHLRRHEDQQTALENMFWTIRTDPNLGHRETAFNLLGQCMEQENRQQDAINCYWLSLQIRSTNNAAKWHICRYLAFLIKKQKTATQKLKADISRALLSSRSFVFLGSMCCVVLFMLKLRGYVYRLIFASEA